MKKKYKYIFIRYCANPNWPTAISHKDPNLSKLTQSKTKRFKLCEYQEAWKFLLECKAPITKLHQILWSFPRKRALNLLESLDALKVKPKDFNYEKLKDCIGGEEVEETLKTLKNIKSD